MSSELGRTPGGRAKAPYQVVGLRSFARGLAECTKSVEAKEDPVRREHYYIDFITAIFGPR